MESLHDVFARLANSAFRSRFRLAARERDHMRARGKETVLDHARGFVAERLAPARPANDGMQTPFRGHPVFAAQHATATCCRSCLSEWHGIPAGHPLTADEQGQVVAATERWLDMRLSADSTGAQQSLPLLWPIGRKRLHQPWQPQFRVLPPTQNGLDDAGASSASCETRPRWPRSSFSAAAISLIEA